MGGRRTSHWQIALTFKFRSSFVLLCCVTVQKLMIVTDPCCKMLSVNGIKWSILGEETKPMKGSHRLIVGALVASKPSSGAARQSEGSSQLTEPFLFRYRKLPPLSLRPWLPSLIVVGAVDPGRKGAPASTLDGW